MGPEALKPDRGADKERLVSVGGGSVICPEEPASGPIKKHGLRVRNRGHDFLGTIGCESLVGESLNSIASARAAGIRRHLPRGNVRSRESLSGIPGDIMTVVPIVSRGASQYPHCLGKCRYVFPVSASPALPIAGGRPTWGGRLARGRWADVPAGHAASAPGTNAGIARAAPRWSGRIPRIGTPRSRSQSHHPAFDATGPSYYCSISTRWKPGRVVHSGSPMRHRKTELESG